MLSIRMGRAGLHGHREAEVIPFDVFEGVLEGGRPGAHATPGREHRLGVATEDVLRGCFEYEVHHEDVAARRVWETVRRDLPSLRAAVEQQLGGRG